MEPPRFLVEHKAVPEDADGALGTNLFGSGQAAIAISGPWLAASLGGNPVLPRVATLARRARHRQADGSAASRWRR